MNSPTRLRRAGAALNSGTGERKNKRSFYNDDISHARNISIVNDVRDLTFGEASAVVSALSYPATKTLSPSSTDKPNNFLESQHHYNEHHQQLKQDCPATFSRTFLWLLTCFLLTGGTLAADLKSCKNPDPVEFAKIELPSPIRSTYPNGTRAYVNCYPNFRVKNGDPELICINGEWASADYRTVECELIHSTGATHCGPFPQIDRGFYGPPADEIPTSGNEYSDDSHPVGTELQAACISTFTLNCTHPHHRFCGRISCQRDGKWVPKDGQLVTACVAAKPVTLTVNGDDDRHGPKSSSLKNYLVLALVLVCIFVVGALTVALLRRPLFCKKREQNQGDGPVHITSASPNHQQLGSDLDSLPVAMNTGIFLPGADYSLQDCQIQDVPFVGTTVFK